MVEEAFSAAGKFCCTRHVAVNCCFSIMLRRFVSYRYSRRLGAAAIALSCLLLLLASLILPVGFDNLAPPSFLRRVAWWPLNSHTPCPFNPPTCLEIVTLQAQLHKTI